MPAVLPIPLPLKVFVISAGVLRTALARFIAVVVVARTIRYFGLAWLGISLGGGRAGFPEAKSVDLHRRRRCPGAGALRASVAGRSAQRRRERYNKLIGLASFRMPKRIAIVEDEAELASLLEYNLGAPGLPDAGAQRGKGHH